MFKEIDTKATVKLTAVYLLLIVFYCFLFRYPVIFYDSMRYLEHALSFSTDNSGPTLLSFMISPFLGLFGPWAWVFFQSLLFCLALAYFCLYFRDVPHVFALGAASVVLSGFPLFTCSVMTDTYTVTGCLSLFLILSGRRDVVVLAVFALSAVAHYGNLPLFVSLCVIYLIFAVSRLCRDRKSVNSAIVGLGLVITGLVAVAASNLLVDGEARVRLKTTNCFMAARIMADMPYIIREFANERPDSLTAGHIEAFNSLLRRKKTLISNDFLWINDPEKAPFQVIGLERYEHEAGLFVLFAIRRHPLDNLVAVLKNTMRLLFLVDPANVYARPNRDFLLRAVEKYFPADRAAAENSLQFRQGVGRLCFSNIFVPLYYLALFIDFLAIPYFLLLSGNSDSRFLKLAVFTVSALLLNSLFLSNLSRPSERYNVRIMLLPLLAAAIIAADRLVYFSKRGVRLKLPARFYQIVLVLAGTLCLWCSRGWQFLVSNQITYLADGVRLADPSFIPRDWHTWQVVKTHIPAAYLTALLYRLGKLQVMTVFAQGICMLVFCAAVWRICRRFFVACELTYILGILWMAFATPYDSDLGALSLISGYFQPSEVAGVLQLMGWALLFERRFVSAGVFFGLSGLLHANFMICLAAVLAVYLVLTAAWRDFANIVRLAVPVCLFWGIHSFLILGRLGADRVVSDKFIAYYLAFRGAHHFHIPCWPLYDSLRWVCWVIVGGVSLWLLHCRDAAPLSTRAADSFPAPAPCADTIAPNAYTCPDPSPGTGASEIDRLFILFISIILVSVLGIVGAGLFDSLFFKRILLWRIGSTAFLVGLLAAFNLWLGLFGFAGAVTSAAEECARRFSLRNYHLPVALLFLSLFSWWVYIAPGRWLQSLRFGLLVIVPMSAIYGRFSSFGHRPGRPSGIGFFFLVCLLLMILGTYNGLAHSSSVFKAPSVYTLGLVRAIRDLTPENAVLVVPPVGGFGALRLTARRAIVVDFKAGATRVDDIREWYRRLCDVSGLKPGFPARILLSGYCYLDNRRARFLQARYGADYVVIYAKAHRGDVSKLEEIYRNPVFRLLKIH